MVACASLLHDLNYIFSDKLEPEAARSNIIEYLLKANYDNMFANDVANIIEDAHLAYRGSRELSNEAKVLADADTLFKAIPTTPILFASRFITQNKYDIEKLANKIIDEQEPLLESETYFYTEGAKNYLKWAKTNLELWKNVLEALDDPEIKETLRLAYELGVL